TSINSGMRRARVDIPAIMHKVAPREMARFTRDRGAHAAAMKTLDRARLDALHEAQREGFVPAHPRSKELFERAKASLHDGVPMNWMVRWASPFPPFVETADGASFRCVDGHDYVDFCLGDTGAMAGHGAAATIAAVERQLRRGITHMLPTEDAIWVGEELQRRFGLPYWQFTLSATDANRFPPPLPPPTA